MMTTTTTMGGAKALGARGNARARSAHRRGRFDVAKRTCWRGKRGDASVRRGLFGLGLPEIVVIGGVAAVLFGPSKLPELGKSLGKTVKSFQEAASVSVENEGARGGGGCWARASASASASGNRRRRGARVRYFAREHRLTTGANAMRARRNSRRS